MKKKRYFSILKYSIIFLCVSIIYLIFSEKKCNYTIISNLLTILGLIYLIIGSYRLVRKLGFFDSFIFGWKKTFEIIRNSKYTEQDSKIGNYIDYIRNNKYKKTYLEFLIVGFGLLFLSFLIITFN